eukprot:g28157.t1
MSPSYACLFVGYVEHFLTGTIPHLFLCYIVGCIGTASCSHEELGQFIIFANTFHPNLKFTWTIFDTSLSFLDLSVSISGNCHETDIYFKPSNSHSYLDCTSSHQPFYDPYSQLLHLHHICSQVGAIHSCTSQMSSYFKDSNFPRELLLVANHFNSASQSLGDVFILGLLQCHNDTTHKLEEQLLIFHLR